MTYDHSSTPKDCNTRQKVARPNLAENYCRRRLAEDVRNEEDQIYDVISGPNQVQVHAHTAKSSLTSHSPTSKNGIPYPAMAADPRLVLSMRLAQYRRPRVVTNLRSIRLMIAFCSASENALIHASFKSSILVLSDFSIAPGFSISWLGMTEFD